MTIRRLGDVAASDAEACGTKATTLAMLTRQGIAVPDGIVLPLGSFDAEGRIDQRTRGELVQAAASLGAARFAVRSSGAAEDRADASFAGRYLTRLNVAPHELAEAAEAVHRSGRGERTSAYRDSTEGVAVLVQGMLRPRAAGIAFTADPVSGARDVVVVHAVSGLGDRLADGTAEGAEWRVVGGVVRHERGAGGVIDASVARRVAALATAIAELLAVPQDIEWALADDVVFALQARPMTALPATVEWPAPRGAFARNFRLGEWLGDPVTPLFESWLLTTMEETMHRDYARLVGQEAPRPLHIVVNGWYYYSLAFLPASPRAIARMLPGLITRAVRAPRRIAPVFPPLARFGIGLYEREWRETLLPSYVAAVERAERVVDDAPVAELLPLIDQLAALAGHYFTSLTFVAGYGWKTEIPFAAFYRRHVRPRIGGHPHLLLRGLARPAAGAHAVQSLDWSFPTLGELGLTIGGDEARLERLAVERVETEQRARAALTPRLAAQFDRLLAEAQRAARLREEQVADLTRAWPVFRRALTRIGGALESRGIIAASHDIHFLTASEVRSASDGEERDRRADAAARRASWLAARRLIAPLALGRMPRLLESLLGAADAALRDPRSDAPDAVRGIPASPGRVTARARIVRDANEFARLRSGEVLVCPLTTPAWTTLFGRAAAIVTDVGSPAAHASLIAREYAIPAVVGTGDGTSRLPDGALVDVDGGAGLVRVVSA